ncbi:MAG: sigma 54-interacting transcriptional regulator [Planctomycetota bacterium]
MTQAREGGVGDLLSSRRFQAILSSISDGVFTVDLEGRIACFNRAAEEITGYSREEVTGRPCREVFRANICHEACALRYTQETGDPVVGLDVTIRNRDDEEIPVSVSTALLRDADGKVIGGVETFRDLRLVRKLQKAVEKSYSVDDIVGKSPKMRELFAKLDILAAGGTTVLVSGETGTGKELVARALHRRSERADAPFVAVNSCALPDTLIEAELFGYVKGAFTGATRDKPGRIAQAEGGTLLLDEIGDLPKSLQVKLLRFLQDRTYEPLGGDRTLQADVRVIAATNRDLEELVESGEFRQDLYYRINVIGLSIPPLRERVEDIPLLVDHFISMLVARKDKPVTGVSPEAMRRLMAHSYPGNVRELENLVEHGFVLCPAGLIRPEHLPLDSPPENGSGENVPRTALEEAERDQIIRTLAEHGGNRLATAEALGIHKTTLFRKIRKLGIVASGRDGRSHPRSRPRGDA